MRVFSLNMGSGGAPYLTIEHKAMGEERLAAVALAPTGRRGWGRAGGGEESGVGGKIERTGKWGPEGYE